jgi:hypothetical protein
VPAFFNFENFLYIFGAFTKLQKVTTGTSIKDMLSFIIISCLIHPEGKVSGKLAEKIKQIFHIKYSLSWIHALHYYKTNTGEADMP